MSDKNDKEFYSYSVSYDLSALKYLALQDAMKNPMFAGKNLLLHTETDSFGGPEEFTGVNIWSEDVVFEEGSIIVPKQEETE